MPEKTPLSHNAAKNALIEIMERDDPITSYDAFAQWLATHTRKGRGPGHVDYCGGPLYLQQAIQCLAFYLAETGDEKQMERAVDGVVGSMRQLYRKKLEAAPKCACVEAHEPGCPVARQM